LTDRLQDKTELPSHSRLNTTEDRVLAELDFEINQITSEHQRPGWTTWAIYGSLVTLLWLLADQFDKEDLDLIRVAQFFLILSLLLEIVRQLHRFLPVVKIAELKPKRDPSPRFISIVKGFSISGLLLHALRFVSITTLILFLAIKVPWPVTGILLLYYGTYTLFVLIAVVTMYVTDLASLHIKPRATQDITKKRYYTVWSCAIVALSIGSVFHLSSVFAYYVPGESSTDLRTAGLLLLITFLVPLVPEESKNRPLLLRLREIRRELAFGLIDLEEAVHQADSALAGIPVDEMLGELVKEVSDEFKRSRTEYARIISNAETLVTTLNTEKIEQQQIEDGERVLKEFGAVIYKEHQRTDELEKLIRRLRVRCSSAEHISSDEVLAAHNLLQTIDSNNIQLTARVEALSPRITELLKRLKPAEKS
jgi:hypothetical protein